MRQQHPPDRAPRPALGDAPEVGVDMLERLARLDPRLAAPDLWTYQSPSEALYEAITTAYETTDPDTQQALVEENETAITLALILNPNTAEVVLLELLFANSSNDAENNIGDAIIDRTLAEAPHIAQQVLDILSQRRNRTIRDIILARSDASRYERYWATEENRQEEEEARLAVKPVIPYSTHTLLLDPDAAKDADYRAHFEDSLDLADVYYAEHLAVAYGATPAWVLARIADKVAAPLASRSAQLRGTSPAAHENPVMIKRLDYDILVNLARSVASHPNVPSRALGRLMSSGHPQVVAHAARHRRAPKKRLEDLALAAVPTDLVAVAGHRSSNVRDHVKALMSTGDLAVLIALAMNEFVLPEDLERLARHEDLGVVRAVAANPSSPPTQLAAFLRHPDAWVRAEAARNPYTPWEAIEEGLQRRDVAIVAGAPANVDAPPEVVLRLAPSVGVHARRLIASNPSSPTAALRRLASDEDAVVRLSVAANPSTPQGVLRAMYTAATEARERRAILANPASPDDTLRLATSAPELHAALARNPRLPVSLQLVLVRYGATKVLRRLAANPATSESVLQHLFREHASAVSARTASGTRDEEVAVRAAMNPSFPIDSIDNFTLLHCSPRVQTAVALARAARQQQRAND